ncbi:MAG: ABC transporter ATP-binding protein [Gallionella sp.]
MTMHIHFKDMEAVRIYWQLFKQSRVEPLLLFLLLMSTVLVQIPVPLIVAKIVNSLAHDSEVSVAYKTIGYLGVLLLLGIFLTFGAQAYGAKIDKKFMVAFHLLAFESITAGAYEKIIVWHPNELYTRINRDAGSLVVLLPTGVCTFVRNVTLLAVFGWMLYSLNGTIFTRLLFFIPVAFVLAYYGNRMLYKLSNNAQASYSVANSVLLESFSHLREALLTRSVEFNLSRLKSTFRQDQASTLNLRYFSAVYFGALSALPIIAAILIWIQCVELVSVGQLNIGQVMSFFVILSMLYAPLSGIITACTSIASEFAALRRVSEVLDSTLGSKMSSDANRDLFANPPAISIVGLDYHIGDKPILSNVNGEIVESGCTLICGANGSGKSTLLSIIAGRCIPTSGTVKFNQSTVPHVAFESNSHRIGFQTQRTFICAETLRTNITIGRAIDDPAIHKLIREIGWFDFLENWPRGLDTVLTQGGNGLSGGQIQKIGILRALLSAPSMLILDEPEIGLDAQSLESFLQFLSRYKARSTIILVSHSECFAAMIDAKISLTS